MKKFVNILIKRKFNANRHILYTAVQCHCTCSGTADFGPPAGFFTGHALSETFREKDKNAI
jgi:hypothetical protein